MSSAYCLLLTYYTAAFLLRWLHSFTAVLWTFAPTGQQQTCLTHEEEIDIALLTLLQTKIQLIQYDLNILRV